MNFLLRVLLVALGLVFAASLIIVMLVLLFFWSLRALGFKLTGRPVQPFVMRMNPRSGFEQVFRKAQQNGINPNQLPRRKLDDVTDVEPKS